MRPLVDSEDRSTGDAAAKDLVGMIRDLTAELIGRSQEVAEMRTRLEFAQKAESTLREQLAKEHERAEQLEAELRKALEARRGWLRRFFGL